VADCIVAYSSRPKGVSKLDAAKLAAFNETIGNYSLGDLHAAWTAWNAVRPDHSPATRVRSRALLMAAVRHGCEAKNIQAPTLPTVKAEKDERVAMLTAGERRRLLASYSPHAAAPVLLLSDQGMRTQEVLRLDWRDVHFGTETIMAGVRRGQKRNKNRKGRPVPMTRRVFMLLWGMWHAAGKPEDGPVFLSSRGKPYQDTNDKGGNPLRSAHGTACRDAGIKDFKVHDWRHDWAARMVMAGVDLFTLRLLGGWASLDMVQRYGAVNATHLRDAIRKIEPLPNPCPTEAGKAGQKRPQAARVVRSG
jgi:integrase